MSRKATPTAAKVLAGNPGKRAINKREPRVDPLSTTTRPPAHIAGPARDCWKRVLSVIPIGQLTLADVRELEIYCTAYAIWLDALEHVRTQGSVVASPVKGDPMQNPYLSILNRQAEMMMKAGSNLGLNPSARSKIQIPEADPGNPFDEFLKPSGTVQ